MAADAFWRRLCDDPAEPPPEVIQEVQRPLPASTGASTFDVVVLGGTLGIFLACALQLRGLSVAVVERNALVGRDQEWNISRADMQVLYCLMRFDPGLWPDLAGSRDASEMMHES